MRTLFHGSNCPAQAKLAFRRCTCQTAAQQKVRGCVHDFLLLPFYFFLDELPLFLMRIFAALITSVVWLAVCGSALAADVPSADWPQFRGPDGNGHSRATGLPLRWSETENIAWKTAVPGRGWSSPVVLGNQIWMTTSVETLATPEEKKQILAGNKYEQNLAIAKTVSLWAVCVDRRTGKRLHNIELFRAEKPEAIHKFNSYATPTPVVEPGRLYCDFGTYGTACIDTAAGRILWKRRLPIEHQVGPGSSPVLHEGLLILVRDGADLQYVTALDKRIGRTVWKTDRPPIDLIDEFKKGFSTPAIIDVGGRWQLIVPGAKWVVSYDPATGVAIWSVNYVKGYSNIPRPIFGHGLVYVSTSGPGQQMWAVRLDGRGDVTETHVAWKLRKTDAQAHVAAVDRRGTVRRDRQRRGDLF